MIELNKGDIEGIESRKFFKRHRKECYGFFFGWLAIAIAIVYAIGDRIPEGFSWQAIAVAILLTIPIIVGVILWQRAENKAVKAFVKECEDNPTLTYVPEPAKDVASTGS